MVAVAALAYGERMLDLRFSGVEASTTPALQILIIEYMIRDSGWVSFERIIDLRRTRPIAVPMMLRVLVCLGSLPPN
jgi:hypothetical protein